MHSSNKTSFLENVDLCFNRAAKALELPKGLARQISTCNAICEMKFGVELRGSYQIFTGWRATHSEHILPARWAQVRPFRRSTGSRGTRCSNDL